MIAGNMSFTYDEIMQLRVAVSELFDMGVKHVSRQGQVSGPNELNVRFAPRPGELDIEITHPSAYWGHGDTELDLESQALLNSLMDKVEFRAEAGAVRMVKYKSGHGP
jgi:anti-sigma regulatory factor (Ser/Thr protein kinase)